MLALRARVKAASFNRTINKSRTPAIPEIPWAGESLHPVGMRGGESGFPAAVT